LKIYNDSFDWNKKLLIGADFGGSSSQDSTAFSIVDPNTLNTLADFKNNKIDPIESADIIYELMTKFFPNSVFIPEENSYSTAVISLLLKTEVANRIYFEYKDKKTEKQMEDGTIKRQKTKVKSYGINTNIETRPLMMEILFDIVNNDYSSPRSPEIIEDIAGLERKKNGKIEHSSVTHDDSLFSYLIVRYVFSYGNNLGRFNIYKNPEQIKTNIENKAMQGARSNDEFVHNFSTILNANFANRKERNLQSEIIEEFKEREQRKKELHEDFLFESGIEKPKSRYSEIFKFNSKKNW